MHSKSTPNRTYRLTPYLITAGLGLSVATAAGAASPDGSMTTDAAVQDSAADEMRSEIPAPTIDTDGDGTADAWDRSGNGKPDAWDTDGDGKPDLLDDDADGKPD